MKTFIFLENNAMLNYTTSPPAAMAASKGTPYIPPEDSLKIRDALTGIIGKGFTDLKSEDARNAYAYLRGQLGNQMASKLITHAMAFNQRTDMLQKNPAAKIQSFYDMGSTDADVHNIIKRASMVSYGPLEGLQTSPDALNMEVSGRKQFNKAAPGGANVAPLLAASNTLPSS